MVQQIPMQQPSYNSYTPAPQGLFNPTATMPAQPPHPGQSFPSHAPSAIPTTYERSPPRQGGSYNPPKLAPYTAPSSNCQATVAPAQGPMHMVLHQQPQQVWKVS